MPSDSAATSSASRTGHWTGLADTGRYYRMITGWTLGEASLEAERVNEAPPLFLTNEVVELAAPFGGCGPMNRRVPYGEHEDFGRPREPQRRKFERASASGIAIGQTCCGGVWHGAVDERAATKVEQSDAHGVDPQLPS